MSENAMSARVFKTSRLSARRWRSNDKMALLEVYGDRDAMRWVDEGAPITEDECDRWLEVTRRNYQLRGYGMFAIETIHEPRTIGFCGLVHPGGQTVPELKYAYSRRFWGTGYATEAAQGLLQWAVVSQQIKFIIATVAPENIPSQRVLLKAGFTEGEIRYETDGSFTRIFEWRSM